MTKEDDMMESNKDFLVTETAIKKTVNPANLISLLRARRTTGTVTFHFNEGGLNAISLVERTKASPVQSDKMREVLGMQ